MELAVAARLVQYAAVAIVGGSSLALARDPAPWPRGLTAAAALAGLVGTALWLLSETLEITGNAADLRTIAVDTAVGRAALARMLFLAAAVVAALPRRPSWPLVASLGGAAAASFAWTGHGAAGLFHLGADVVHLLAAMTWLGALPVLAILVLDRREPTRAARALHGFSAIGPGLVALIVLSGAVNSWLLVGPANLLKPFDSPYGQLLAAKLGLFAAMLGLAAANRWKLTPALDQAIGGTAPPPRALVLALVLETLLGLGVLVLVAAMGTLPPPAHD